MTLITNDFYTADEVAQLLNVSKKSIYRWVKGGLLPATSAHRMLWIDKAKAHDFKKPKRGRGKSTPSTK